MTTGERIIKFYEECRHYGLSHDDSFEIASFAENHLYQTDKETFYVSVYIIMRKSLSIDKSNLYAKLFAAFVAQAAEDLNLASEG